MHAKRDSQSTEQGWGEFPNTVLKFSQDLQIDLRELISERMISQLKAIGLDQPFGVVTACNPKGTLVSPLENRKRMATLHRELSDTQLFHLSLDACSLDGSHCEESVAIIQPRDNVISFARRFDQLAIFWWDGVRFWIIPVLADTLALVLPIR